MTTGTVRRSLDTADRAIALCSHATLSLLKSYIMSAESPVKDEVGRVRNGRSSVGASWNSFVLCSVPRTFVAAAGFSGHRGVPIKRNRKTKNKPPKRISKPTKAPLRKIPIKPRRYSDIRTLSGITLQKKKRERIVKRKEQQN